MLVFAYLFDNKKDHDVISPRERRNYLIQQILVFGLVAIHFIAVITFVRFLTLPFFGTEQDWETASETTTVP